MTSVLHFSYFNKVYNHFYTCNCNDQVIEKNQMGWACGVYGWGEGGV